MECFLFPGSCKSFLISEVQSQTALLSLEIKIFLHFSFYSHNNTVVSDMLFELQVDLLIAASQSPACLALPQFCSSL